MAQFRESEHPRDKEGKFKDKGASDRVNELVDKYSDNPEQDKKNNTQVQNNNTSNNATLTKQEWALYYKEIQKVERGEFSSQVNVLSKNTRAVFIETNARSTLVIDNNKGKVIINKFFDNYDKMLDYYKEFLKREN